MKALVSLIQKIGWDKVFDIAERQGISALCFDAVQHNKGLSARVISSPEGKQRLLRMYGTSVQMERQYAIYEKSVKELSSFAAECGLQMLVLKGYGLSMNYPVPAHRPCGDIDVYVIPVDSGSGFKSLDEGVEQRMALSVDRSSKHHSRFVFNGYLVENHITVMDPDSHKEYEELNRLLADEAGKGLRVIDGVILPSFRFYGIHLLAHMAADFASTGTNLRRLLDWATFVERAQDAEGVDWDFIFATAERFGMSPFLNAINDICVRYLGFGNDLFPVRIEAGRLHSFQKLSDRVFSDLIACHDTILRPSQTNAIRYAWVKGMRFIKNLWKYDMVYKESAWKALVTLGMRKVVMFENQRDKQFEKP